MKDFNPYEAPRQDSFNADVSGAWQDGPLMVLSKDAVLPDRCIQCNGPAEGYRLKRSLHWHSPGWYLLILFNIILYAIVALCVQHTAKIYVGVCPEHRARRRRVITIAWLSLPLAIGVWIVGSLAFPPDWIGVFIVVGIVLILVGAIYGTVASRLFVTKRIDKRFVWLARVNLKYLTALPDWGTLSGPDKPVRLDDFE